jgi:hypothetical protein
VVPASTSPKTIEDLRLADDLRGVSPWLAGAIDNAATHEEVDEIERGIADLLATLT